MSWCCGLAGNGVRNLWPGHRQLYTVHWVSLPHCARQKGEMIHEAALRGNRQCQFVIVGVVQGSLEEWDREPCRNRAAPTHTAALRRNMACGDLPKIGMGPGPLSCGNYLFRPGENDRLKC
jgi:hypothetical protein